MTLSVPDRVEIILAHATKPMIARIYRGHRLLSTSFDCKRTGRLRLRCSILAQIQTSPTEYVLRCINERVIIGRYHAPVTTRLMSGYATWPNHHSIRFDPKPAWWLVCGGGA